MIFNYKFQFLHNMVEDTAYYHCGHYWTSQCIAKWRNADFLFGCVFLLLNVFSKCMWVYYHVILSYILLDRVHQIYL